MQDARARAIRVTPSGRIRIPVQFRNYWLFNDEVWKKEKNKVEEIKGYKYENLIEDVPTKVQ